MVLDSVLVQNFHYLAVAWVKISSSVHIDNKKKDVLILGKSPTQRLTATMLTAEAQYSITFSRSNRKICLSLHYNESKKNMLQKLIIQFKANYSKIKKYPLCLENILGDFLASNMKKKYRIKLMCVRFFC